MTFKYYNVIRVYVEDNTIKEETIKRTMNEEEAKIFLELARELKPEDRFYMYSNLED